MLSFVWQSQHGGADNSRSNEDKWRHQHQVGKLWQCIGWCTHAVGDTAPLTKYALILRHWQIACGGCVMCFTAGLHWFHNNFTQCQHVYFCFTVSFHILLMRFTLGQGHGNNIKCFCCGCMVCFTPVLHRFYTTFTQFSGTCSRTLRHIN